MARHRPMLVLFLIPMLALTVAGQSGLGPLPVAAQSASPVAAVAETLLEITIPPDLLPQGDRILSELIYMTAPGGSTARWTVPTVDWPGLRVHHLLTGTLSVRAEGAAQVVRAGEASVEDVPARMEVVLEPGDTWLARNEIPFEAVNTSASPAHLLLWVAANNEHPTELVRDAFPAGTWVFGDMNPFPQGVEVPPGPVTLRIRRIALPVEGRVAAMPGALQHAVRPPTNLEGTPVVDPSVGVLPSGTVVNIGRKPVPAYVLSLEPMEAETTAPAGGTPMP